MNNNIIVENSGLEIHQNTEFSTSIPENSSGSQEPSSYSTQDYGRLSSISHSDLENIQVVSKQYDRKKLKWELQRIGKQILTPSSKSYVTLPGATQPTYIRDKWYRVRGCYQTPLSREIDIVHSKTSKKAHFSNVSTCSNVHSCPVCSSYIAAKRCEEIKLGIKNHFQLHPGGSVNMMVLTCSHTRHDDLKELLDKLKKAREFFFADWFVKETIKNFGTIGKINSFEITYSKLNGWHPHNHILFFSSQKLDVNILRDTLSRYWLKALEYAGLSGSEERALNIYGGEYASQYVTKLAEEISLSNSKLGNITSNIPHYAPFQLLDYIKLNSDNENVTWAVNAFREYSEVMRGRKSIVWSKGLKVLLGVVECPDEEAALPSEPDLMVYVSISKYDWNKITREQIDYRPMILQAAEMSREYLINYLGILGLKVVDRGEYPFIRKPPIIERR